MPVVMFNGKYNHNDTESLLFYSYKIFKTVKTNATHYPQAEPAPHLYYFAPVDTAGARQWPQQIMQLWSGTERP